MKKQGKVSNCFRAVEVFFIFHCREDFLSVLICFKTTSAAKVLDFNLLLFILDLLLAGELQSDPDFENNDNVSSDPPLEIV